MSKYSLLLLFSFVLLLAGCKRDMVPRASEKDIASLNIRTADFRYLTTRSRINYEGDNKNLSARATIRMRKDSVIWVSITVPLLLNMEAARGLVTRDSVFLVNYAQKEYYAFSFAELSKRFNVPIDFNVLQSALLGDPIIPITTNSRIKRTAEEIMVLQQQQGIDIINYFDNQSIKLEKVIIQEPESPNNLMLQYDGFQVTGNNVLPSTSKITAQYLEKNEMKATSIGFQDIKAEFSDTALEFPFSIPSRYERKK